MELIVVLCLLILVVSIGYLYSLKKKFSYWKDRNVSHLKPTFFYGNMKQIVQNKMSLADLIHKVYYSAKSKGEKYGGFYDFFTPNLVPVDIELAKNIVTRDFTHFINRGLYVNEETDALTAHLVNLEDEKWRLIRVNLTPVFTTGKMKMMFKTMVAASASLEELLKESARLTEPIDIKGVLSRFTTDVIGLVAFGLECNCIKNPHADFLKYGEILFEQSLRASINFTVTSILPKWIFTAIGYRVFPKDMEDFYTNVVKNTIEYREKNNILRKDFIHFLTQIKSSNLVYDDGKINNVSEQGLTLQEMAAQAFVFFVGGFETASTTMTFALLELAQCQDIQNKLRDEILLVLNKYNNEITYESIVEMELLERVLLETLRKHPAVPALARVCTKDYQIPDSDLIIKRGTKVTVPICSIHRDAEYFPDPDKFDPERFSEENRGSRPAAAFMPFGEGPRNCIGMRFGKLQTKVGLCTILRNYRVRLSEKTKTPIKYGTGPILFVEGDVWVYLEPISKY